MTTYDGSIDWPHLEQFSAQPVFNTKAVVQQTGVPAPTLRAWERRYSLLAPERANNAYRLYSERDVALIRWLKDRVDSGVSISHAIALFRHLEEQQQQSADMVESEIYFNITPPPAFQVALNSPAPDIAQVTRTAREEEQNSAQDPLPEPLALPDSYQSSTNPYPTRYTMEISRKQLIDIFQDMDEQAAQVLMGTMLSFYSVEQVCSDLIVPTLWDIGRLWAEGSVTVSVEHFASNFFRAVLTNMFHMTRGPLTGPIILACCAPGEPHELSMLMLSLLLRRHGMRVVYLGQSIETTGLVHTVKKLEPVIVCISLTLPAYMPALMGLGRQLQSLPGKPPAFVFGGQAFMHFPHPEQLIPEGIYLNGDLQEIMTKIQLIMSEQK
ncbi:MerR family transcriptional regulator [Dictyobacter vulcani]|uniref:MerR family transcriptional regulator n=1 Tax=Dictyobacter vulcani TaxID=2607529 RepID=A0A5J4KMU4_9CHLR|nr:MerR family transcriptional regulator [Dictyobacter vulcani]GER87439.1 MerR family transcriptional regulator [Dictyobacter vulcani]